MTTQYCAMCRRRALFQTKKNRRHRSGKGHDLCERCWRAVCFAAESEDRSRKAAPATFPKFPPLVDIERKVRG